jgi:hypothetical protein
MDNILFTLADCGIRHLRRQASMGYLHIYVLPLFREGWGPINDIKNTVIQQSLVLLKSSDELRRRYFFQSLVKETREVRENRSTQHQ